MIVLKLSIHSKNWVLFTLPNNFQGMKSMLVGVGHRSSRCVGSFFFIVVLDKAVFCFGEKQGMFVNDECSSWYKRASDWRFGINAKSCVWMDQHARPVRPTPPQCACRMTML